ncbi:MAG: hypothetical protein O3A80_04940 [bacterium]|nr:hypothetical protein [bacterium]
MRRIFTNLGTFIILGVSVSTVVVLAQLNSNTVLHSPEYGAKVFTKDFISKTLVIDDIYPSMRGPYDKVYGAIEPDSPPEPIWIKNIDFIAIDMDGRDHLTDKHLCHGQLLFEDMKEFSNTNAERFFRERTLPRKVFTGIQGQLDLPLPDGFGIPVYSDETLEFITMAFNLDPEVEPFDMKVKTQVSYIKDSDTNGKMRSLGKSAIDITLPISHEAFTGNGNHSACGVTLDDQLQTGRHAVDSSANLRDIGEGQKGTNHFLVAPGIHEYKYQIDGSEIVPFDTTVHMILGHLHPYGDFLEIKDLTTNEVLFVSHALPNEKFHYVQNMTSYSSPIGIPFFVDHKYEYRAVYDNTSDQDIDAMAVMYFYFHDKVFDRENI